MPNIPVSDPLKRQANGGTPARSVQAPKLVEGATDADKLKGQPISTVAPTDGQALTWRGTEYVPETPAVTPASTPSGVTEHAIFGTEHSGDFELTLNGGLSVTVGTGTYRVGTTVFHAAGPSTKTLTAGVTNTLYLNVTGSIAVATGALPSGAIPLWQIGMLGSEVSTVTDKRAPFATLIVTTDAPADAEYLVATAHAGLSAEIVVGATPGGELGGTWPSPTVDANHGGTHAIGQGGTGQVTAQAAINALSAVAAATNEHVFTKDTATGNAIFKAAAGGGGAPHAILDGGAAHTDSVTQTVSVGSLIYGNSTPKWDELGIGIPAAGLRNVLGVDNGDIIPSYKTVLDTTNPADIAAAAAPGTSLVFARRDHVHALSTTLYYSEVHYGFAPDALPTVAVATGAPQGRIHLTGDVAETGIEVVTSCRVAGTTITLIIEIGSTNDMDTATWSTYKSVTLGSGVKGQIDAITDSLPADRLLRLNVSAVSGTWSGITCDLRAKRPLRI